MPPGYLDACQCRGEQHRAARRATPRVAPFDANPGNFGFVNSDLAFSGDNAIVGNFNGFQVYDVSDPAAPTLRSSFVCPGGQGDVSVYGDLLFMSVEETRGRIDCGTQGAPGAVNLERFRGVRIFDISNIDNPVQLPGVQTCRGSHTHTLVTDPDDPDNVYIYNSGTSGVRIAARARGLRERRADHGPGHHGQPDAVAHRRHQGAARGARDGRGREPAAHLHRRGDGRVQRPAEHPSGAGAAPEQTPRSVAYSPNPNTNTCHDITAYPEIGLAAGACQGNGILLDISDPANPVRIDAVADPNFSYWHSATFNNDGTKVIFTDEWGGGTQPRCRATDQPEWGANALFDIVDGKLEFASYYKLPAVQTSQENCVAHNGSIVPVPGRDIMVQAWYQGGLSIIDFTDTANPTEIAYLDRGPINDAERDRAEPRRLLVDVLVQRQRARQRDRARLRQLWRSLRATRCRRTRSSPPARSSSTSSTPSCRRCSCTRRASPWRGRTSTRPSAPARLSGNALKQVNKSIDQAEKLSADPANADDVVDHLANAARKSGAPADSDLVQALNALADTFR